MARETPNQKLKKEVLELKKKLFAVVNNPDSQLAQWTVIEQKQVAAYQHLYSKSKTGSPFFDMIKEIGFSRETENKTFYHFES